MPNKECNDGQQVIQLIAQDAMSGTPGVGPPDNPPLEVRECNGPLTTVETIAHPMAVKTPTLSLLLLSKCEGRPRCGG